MTPVSDHTAITLRQLDERDEPALKGLAELDSSPLPPAPVIGAEIDGSLIAAVSLHDGSAVADPFKRSVESLDLLRARARQLVGRRRRRRRRSRAALPGSPPGAGGRLLQLSGGTDTGGVRII
jgi:hypothetical protein